MSEHMPQIPAPGPLHAKFKRFVGRWSGTETVQASPWMPGGEANASYDMDMGLNGHALLQTYQQQRGGKPVFDGLGVMTVDIQTNTVLWWWFGPVNLPLAPAKGQWDGDALVFEGATPHGEYRTVYAFDGNDRFTFKIENKAAGQNTFTDFMVGHYTRDS